MNQLMNIANNINSSNKEMSNLQMQGALNYLWILENGNGQNGYAVELNNLFEQQDINKLKLSVKNYLNQFEDSKQINYLNEYFA